MKLVAITRILNEDDIVEAFARHHRWVVDHHIFLDNGSHDRTCDILRALHEEGLGITLLQVRSAAFAEAEHLTRLYRYAAISHKADWVLSLDADEFVAAATGETVRAVLGSLGAEIGAARVRLVRYPDCAGDDKTEAIVPRRQKRRDSVSPDVFKFFVRGGPDAGVIELDPGSHGVRSGGRPIAAAALEDISLAHYPRRSGWQQISKFLIGRLKAIAGGRAVVDAHHADHYAPLFELLRDRPQEVLLNGDFLRASGTPDATVEDPIAYYGEDLKYTQATDDRMKAVKSLVAFTEGLARQHGRLLDENSAVRALVQGWADQIVRVF